MKVFNQIIETAKSLLLITIIIFGMIIMFKECQSNKTVRSVPPGTTKVVTIDSCEFIVLFNRVDDIEIIEHPKSKCK